MNALHIFLFLKSNLQYISQSTEASEATSQQTELDTQQSSPSLPFGSTENGRLQSMNRDLTILQGTSLNQTTALPDLSHNSDYSMVATSTITAVSVVQNSAESMDNFTAYFVYNHVLFLWFDSSTTIAIPFAILALLCHKFYYKICWNNRLCYRNTC